MVSENGLVFFGKMRMIQVKSGDIHRHGHHRKSGIQPAADLSAHLAEDNAVQFGDDSVAFKQRNKTARINEAPFWIDPPHKRFSAGKSPALRVIFRLIVYTKVLVFKRFHHFIFQIALVQRPG